MFDLLLILLQVGILTAKPMLVVLHCIEMEMILLLSISF